MQLGKIKRNFLMRQIIDVHLERELTKLKRKYEPGIKELFTSQSGLLDHFTPLEQRSLQPTKIQDVRYIGRFRLVDSPDVVRSLKTRETVLYDLDKPRVSVYERQFDFTLDEVRNMQLSEESDPGPVGRRFLGRDNPFQIFCKPSKNDYGGTVYSQPEWLSDVQVLKDPIDGAVTLFYSDNPQQTRELIENFDADLKDLFEETTRLGVLVHQFLSDAKTLKQVTDNWSSVKPLIPESWFEEEQRRKQEAEERRKQQLVQEQLNQAKKFEGRETTGELLDSKLRSTIGARRLRGG